MNVSLCDVMIHIDENLTAQRRHEVETRLRELDGVVSVANHNERPHLTIIEYLHEKIDSKGLLDLVRDQGVHAELVGL